MSEPTYFELTVPEERHSDFHAKIATLQKRAAKAKLPALTVTLVGTAKEPIKPDSKLTRTVFTYGVATTETIALGGWSLLGVVEYLPDGTPLLREVPGQTVPDSYRTGERTCDYCALDRNRKETFIVSHPETGTKRVGRNCLSEFLGVSPERFLASVTWLKALKEAGEWGGWGFGWVPETFTPEFLLTAAVRVAATDGYRSKAAAAAYNEQVPDGGKTVRSTAEATGTYLDALAGRLPKGYDRRGRYDLNAEVKAHYGEVTDADVERAKVVLAFAKAFPTATTYGYNLHTLANADMVQWKHAGTLISAIGTLEREEGKQRERAAAPAAANRHLGVLGGKLEATAVVQNAQTFDGMYGVRTLVTFRTAEGDALKWWATGNKVSDFAKGATVTLKGTVKAHEEWKGTKQTTLTRVSVVA